MSDVLTQGRAPARFARAAPADAPELMEEPDCDRSDLAEALDLLGRVARRTGGDRLLLRQVRALLATRPPGPLRLLDVGTGGGHTALALDRALRDRGWAPSFVLADLHARTLDICRERLGRSRRSDRFRLVRLDGAGLPLKRDSVDIAFSAMTLHHLEDARARRFVGELDRVSRLGWVLVDLRRSRLTQAIIGLLAATAWRRVTFSREDGPASVRRSFTPAEIETLLAGSGLEDATVEGRIMRWAARGTA